MTYGPMKLSFVNLEQLKYENLILLLILGTLKVVRICKLWKTVAKYIQTATKSETQFISNCVKQNWIKHNKIQFVTKVNFSFIVMSKGMIYKRVNVVEIRSPAFVVASLWEMYNALMFSRRLNNVSLTANPS